MDIDIGFFANRLSFAENQFKTGYWFY